MALHSLRERLRRHWLRLLLLSLTLVPLLFVAAVLASANLPPVRAWVAERATGALAETFRGRLSIQRVGHLGLFGVGGVDAELLDPEGRSVLQVRGLDVRLSLPRLAWEFLGPGKDPAEIRLHRIQVTDARLTLIDDGQGTPTVVSAFAPKKRAARESGPAPSVFADAISIRHAWIAGRLPNTPPIDVDLAPLEGRLALEQGSFRADLRRLGIEARGLPRDLNPRGELTGNVFTRSAPRVLEIATTFGGTLAGMPLRVEGRLEDGQVEGRLRVDKASPGSLHALLPELRPRQPVSLLAEVHGRLPLLRLDARLNSGKSVLTVLGNGSVAKRQAEIELSTTNLDLSGFLPNAPRTRLMSAAGGSVFVPKGLSPQGKARVVMADSWVAGEDVPRTVLEAAFGSEGANRALNVRGSILIEEPGATTELDVRLAAGATKRIELRGTTKLEQPPRLVRLAGITARGALELRGDIDLDRKELAAKMRANLAELVGNSAEAKGVALEVAASGALADPRIQVLARAEQVAGGGQRWSRVRLDANGTSRRLCLAGSAAGERARSLTLDACATREPDLRIAPATLVVAQGATRAEARMENLTLRQGRLAIDQLRVKGVGRAQLGLQLEGGEVLVLDIDSEKLDLGKLAQLATGKPAPATGRLSLRARYARGGGTLSGEIEGVGFKRVRGGLAKVNLELENERLSGSVELALAPTAKTEIRLEKLDLARLPLRLGDVNRLERLQGNAEISGEVDLGALPPELTARLPQLKDADGRLSWHAQLSGESGKKGTELNIALTGRGLVVQGINASASPEAAATIRPTPHPGLVRPLDVELDLGMDAEGALQCDIGLSDRRGTRASFEATTNVPLRELGNGREELREVLLNTPAAAKFSMEVPDLRRWPVGTADYNFRGSAALEGQFRGTALDPDFQLEVILDDFAETDPHGIPLGIQLRLAQAAEGGEFSLRGSARKKPVVEVRADWRGRLRDFGSEARRTLVRADASARLQDFPLEAVPMLRARHVQGELDGHVSLKDLGGRPRVVADLRSRSLRLAKAEVETAALTVTAGAGHAQGAARIQAKQGNLVVNTRSGFEWQGWTAPTLTGVHGRLVARDFRLGTIEPLLQGAVSDLDGVLDADLALRLEGDRPEVRGTASLDEGRVELPSVGQRFSEVKARARMEKDTVRLEHLSARGTTGRIRASGDARLSGSAVSRAKLEATISEGESIPITVEGMEVGDAWGKVQVEYQAQPNAPIRTITVRAPRLHVTLPETATRSVQPLGAETTIRAGVQRDGEFKELPLERPSGGKVKVPSKFLIVNVELGKDVWIRRGTQLEVQLRGGLRAELDGDATIEGQIELAGGTLDVQGKIFRIERGVITFDPREPSNPTVVATARWDSPGSEYRVYASFTGTVKNGDLDLRSEPPLTENQIVSLLAFGSPEGSFGTGGGDSAAVAVGVAGGTAAKGLNRALSSLTSLDLTTRVDTSTGEARPELVLQLSPRVAVEVSYAVGQPGPGEAPDRTFLSVDMRLLRRWSLTTSMGDKGASAGELIWRYRY